MRRDDYRWYGEKPFPWTLLAWPFMWLYGTLRDWRKPAHPTVYGKPTGGTFSLGAVTDIPYCATAGEISRYLTTEVLVSHLSRLQEDIDDDLTITYNLWLQGDPATIGDTDYE